MTTSPESTERFVSNTAEEILKKLPDSLSEVAATIYPKGEPPSTADMIWKTEVIAACITSAATAFAAERVAAALETISKAINSKV